MSTIKMQRKCLLCQSTKLIKGKPIGDGGQHSKNTLSVVVGAHNPNAFLIKNFFHVDVMASICGDCGNTQLYVEEPAALWEQYQTLPEDGGGPKSREPNSL